MKGQFISFLCMAWVANSTLDSGRSWGLSNKKENEILVSHSSHLSGHFEQYNVLHLALLDSGCDMKLGFIMFGLYGEADSSHY